MEPVWHPWASVPDQALLDSGGPATLAVVHRLREHGFSGPGWILPRKAFRRAASDLPSGHRPLDLLAQKAGPSRDERAARAHARLLGARHRVPPLSVATPRCLVWASAVLRPRRASAPGLTLLVSTPSERWVEAVTELWATVCLEPVLEGLPASLRRVELAIGLFEERPELGELVAEALRSARAPGEDPLPWLGQGKSAAPAVTFDRSLAELRSGAAWPLLKQEFGGTLSALDAVTAFGPALGRDRTLLAIEHLGSTAERAVALEMFGPTRAYAAVRGAGARGVALGHIGSGPTGSGGVGSGDVGSGGELRSLSWARFAKDVASDVARARQQERRVEALQQQAQSRRGWMAEVDLGLLPDDGLRRTLEQELDLARQAACLSVETALSAARLVAAHGELSQVPAGTLDRGLRYPAFDWAEDFERLWLRLSGEHEARSWADRALESHQEDPLGERAPKSVEIELARFRQRHSDVLLASDPVAEQVFSLALCEALSSQKSTKVLLATELELARVRADRVVAESEKHVPRFWASQLATLGSLSRGALLLRERARALDVLADSLLRRVALEVDRRLVRLEVGLARGAVWHCTPRELILTVDMRGVALQPRVTARARGAARYHAASRLEAPFPFESEAPPQEPVSLARLRGLHLLPWLAVEPSRIRYEGRSSDTLPALLRALDQGGC